MAALIRTVLINIVNVRYLSKLAGEADLSRQVLKNDLSPVGNPEFATVIKIHKTLGLKPGVQHAGLAVYSNFTFKKPSSACPIGANSY